MVALHGSKARLFANGWDLTSYMKSGSPAFSADVADVSTWGMTSKAYIPGKTDATFTGEGIWDRDSTTPGTTDKIDEILRAAIGQLGTAIHLPRGEGLGNPANIIKSVTSSYEITSPQDDATSLSFEMQSSVGNAVGRVLQPLAGALSLTATGNGSNVDDQAYWTPVTPGVTLFGGVGALAVINKGGGAGNLTVRIESSPNGSTGWVTLATFAVVSAIRAHEVVEVLAGVTINRYLRAAWTVTGGTWDINVSFARRQA